MCVYGVHNIIIILCDVNVIWMQCLLATLLIDILQMQFFIVIAQNVYALYTDCDYDKRVEWACVIYLSSLFILFMNFFIRSYVKHPPQRHRQSGQEQAHTVRSEEQRSSMSRGESDVYSRTVGANGGVHLYDSSLLSNKKKDWCSYIASQIAISYNDLGTVIILLQHWLLFGMTRTD